MVFLTPILQSDERRIQLALLHKQVDRTFYNQQIKFTIQLHQSDGNAFLKARVSQANGSLIDFANSEFKVQFEQFGGDEAVANKDY